MRIQSFTISLLAVAALAQSPAPLTFEVASIKPADPNARGVNIGFVPGGGIRMINAPLKEIISFAYDLRDFQILGGPGWIANTRYDLLAKPEGAQGPGELRNIPDKQRDTVVREIRERLRSLLAERFELSVHKETRELPVYALVVAKSGVKMEESKEGDGGPRNMNRNVNGNNGRHELTAKRASLEMLTMAFSNTLGRPVLDKTGLTANYDLKMEWVNELSAAAPETAGSDVAGPSIFTAVQEQLGLRLESQKGPVEVIVIDRVEKASDN